MGWITSFKTRSNLASAPQLGPAFGLLFVLNVVADVASTAM
jgi:hypothetical protein